MAPATPSPSSLPTMRDDAFLNVASRFVNISFRPRSPTKERSSGPAARPFHPQHPRPTRTAISRLEEAGRALLSLPNTGPSTRLVQSGLEWIRDAAEQSAAIAGEIRPAVPDAATISRMDEATGLDPAHPAVTNTCCAGSSAPAACQPDDRAATSIAGARSPRPLGADHKAVQRWHAQGIDIIVAALARPAARQAAPVQARHAQRPHPVRPAARPRPAAAAPS